MHSELKSWLEVLRLRKGMVVLFSLLIVVLSSLFLMVIWEYHSLENQTEQFNSQLELIVELDQDLVKEQREFIRKEIEGLDMVRKVEYWSPEKSGQYVDNQVLSGYLSFLKKNDLDLPFNPVLRISLMKLSQKDDLEKLLAEKYQTRLILVDSSIDNEQSFIGDFLQNIAGTVQIFRVLMIVILMVLLFVFAYFKIELLSERSRGFHLTQFLHLSSPYTFWPALLVTVAVSLFLSLVSLIVVFFISGELLWVLTMMLLVAFVLLDLILLWLGRYVIDKWHL